MRRLFMSTVGTHFNIPRDSLAHRYSEAYRQFTWEGVRGPSGVKILPEIREQTGPTCIYEACAVWLETMLRLKGITCKISAKDLQTKEQGLMTEKTDRTIRCLDVLKNIGLCSEDDFESQNPNATLYRISSTTSLMPVNEEDLREATRRMKEVPLLVVFHVGVNYNDYVTKFLQIPILSYEKFEEGEMRGHGACAIGYGVESIVPFWKFINSHGKFDPTKGLGRVLPQNVYYLIAPGCLVIDTPEAAAPPPAAPEPVVSPPVAPNLKRKRPEDEIDSNAQAAKRQKL